MYSTVMSAASFSVILAETFAAVGLSTIVPAGVVTLARLAKNLPADQNSTGYAAANDALTEHSDNLNKTPAKAVNALVKSISESRPSLDLLLPKTAKIHAEFTFEGSERYSGEAAVGLMIDVVSVKAGASALYETKSTNKITLDVDFVSVNIPL